MTTFFERFDRHVADCDPKVRETMTAANYTPEHTGGGCMVWQRDCDDGKTIIYISSDNDINGDPNKAEWAVGRYGCEEGFLEIDVPMTLAGALAIADKIPSPLAGNDVLEQQMTAAEVNAL